jgi:hypothetical protein
MRWPRFTILQLMLVAALVALLLGLFTSSWRVSAFHQIEQLAFSPRGTLLAAKYSGGAVQVWRVADGSPRLVAQALRRPQILIYDGSTIHFLSEDKLLRLEPRFAGAAISTRLEELTISTRAVREVGRLDGFQAYPGFQSAGGEHVAYIDWQNMGQIGCFDLRAQRLSWERNLGASASLIALSADGRTLAAMDQNGTIHVLDANSGQTQQKFAAGGLDRVAISGDGKLLAIPQSAAAPASGTAVIRLHPTQSPDAHHDIVTNLQQVWSVSLSADGLRLAAITNGAVECYDIASRQRLARVGIEDPHYSALSVIPISAGQVMLSPNGDVLAMASGGRILLHEVPGGRLTHVITGGPRWLHVVIFTLGFALWSAAWGIVGKRERDRRPAPEPKTLPSRRPPAAKRPANTSASGIVALVVITIAVACLVAANWPITWDAALATFSWLTGGLFLVVALGFIYYWLVRLFMGPHYFTLLRLRQITGTPGRLFVRGSTQFWFAAPSPYEAHVGPICEEVAARTRALFGEGAARPKETLIAWLDQQADLDAFLRQHVPIAAVVPSVWSARCAVVCEETALRNFGRPASALRAAVALLCSIRVKRGLLPGWVAGLVSRELCQDDESAAEWRAATRRMKVLLARRPDWNPRTVLNRPTAERRDLWLSLDEAASWREVRAEIDFLATLAPLLFGPAATADRRDKSRAWLRAVRPKDDPIATLTHAIGVSLDDLLAEWRQALDRCDGLPYDVPPPQRQVQLQSLISQRILDRTLPAAERARAVRCLGGTSYAGAAGVLIALVDDPRCEFRDEIIRSLENLSGRALGDDLTAWQAWWSALPAAIRWDEDSTPVQEKSIEAAAPDAMLSGIVAAVLTNGTRPPAPVELRLVFCLMAIGGVIALAIPITLMFLIGPLLFVTIYFSLLVGVQAVARGAARDTNNLAGTARLQAANILACDPINLVLSIVEHALLGRQRVRNYLAEWGGSSQRT